MDSAIMGILGTVVGAVASGYCTLRATRGQVEAALRQVRGGVSDRLYETNRSMLGYFAQYPRLRPYFYDEKPLSDCTDEDDRNRLLSLAGMLADLLELVVLDLRELPAPVQGRWELFVYDTYHASPVIQGYLKSYGDWYAPELHRLVRGPRPGGGTATPAAA